MMPADKAVLSTSAEKPAAPGGGIMGVAEIAQLRAERDLLGDMIASLRTPDEALPRLLRSVIALTGCAADAIYLYDVRNEVLHLHSAEGLISGGSSCSERVALGEGIVGQAALSQQPLLVNEQKTPSLPFLPFDSRSDPQSQVHLAIPILSKENTLLGVIALQSERPRAFSEDQLVFIRQSAHLAASVIEHALQDEAVQRRTRTLMTFSALTQSRSVGLSSRDLLASLADLTRQLLLADLCIILLLDQTSGDLTVHATSPAQHVFSAQLLPIHLEQQMVEALLALSDPKEYPALAAYTFDHVNPLKQADYKGLFVVPLLRERVMLGLLSCYFSSAFSLNADDRLTVQSIANQATRVLECRSLLDLLTHRHLVKGFFDLLHQQAEDTEDAGVLRLNANFLGLNLDHIHCVALMEIGGDAEEGFTPAASNASIVTQQVTAHFESLLRHDYPGSLLYEQDHILTCLIDLSADPTGSRLQDWLRDQHLQMSSAYAQHLSIGVSNPYLRASDSRRGIAEAGQALQMGHSVNPEGGVICFRDIRVYQYITHLAHDVLHDPYQEKFGVLARYDQRQKHSEKRDRLLETLEAFLDSQGNLLKAAARLRIHRNTVEQRLRRIGELADIDVLADEDTSWHFDLRLALRVYKLNARREE